MAGMPIDTDDHASEDEHVGAGMTSMLHADMRMRACDAGAALYMSCACVACIDGLG